MHICPEELNLLIALLPHLKECYNATCTFCLGLANSYRTRTLLERLFSSELRGRLDKGISRPSLKG